MSQTLTNHLVLLLVAPAYLSGDAVGLIWHNANLLQQFCTLPGRLIRNGKYLRPAPGPGAESDIPPASCLHIHTGFDGQFQCPVNAIGCFPAHLASWEIIIVLILSVWSTSLCKITSTLPTTWHQQISL